MLNADLNQITASTIRWCGVQYTKMLKACNINDKWFTASCILLVLNWFKEMERRGGRPAYNNCI